MFNTKKFEVETVIRDFVVVGFRCRVEMLYGFLQERENHWMATKNLLNPDWKGMFKTRNEARIYLEALSDNDLACNLDEFEMATHLNNDQTSNLH